MLTEMKHRGRGRSGFTLIELLVVIAIIAILIGILLPALSEARRVARLLIDQSNQRQLNTASESYVSEYSERLPSFTNTHDGNNYRIETQYADLRDATTAVQAAANQAVDILRRRAGREDIQRITGWIPHVLYSHLILQDYMAQRLPEPGVVNPQDRNRLEWQRDPANFESLGVPVPSNAGGNAGQRWPYSSSYNFNVAAYDRNASRDIRSTAVANRRILPASSSSYSIPTNADLGSVSVSDLRFPSQKVFLSDRYARHFGRRPLFYAWEDARLPVAFFDGSVRVITTGDSNPGWRPNSPTSAVASIFLHRPEQWEPPLRDGGYPGGPLGGGSPPERHTGYYAWTRGGLQGVDFGGDEISTGQPRN